MVLLLHEALLPNTALPSRLACYPRSDESNLCGQWPDLHIQPKVTLPISCFPRNMLLPPFPRHPLPRLPWSSSARFCSLTPFTFGGKNSLSKSSLIFSSSHSISSREHTYSSRRRLHQWFSTGKDSATTQGTFDNLWGLPWLSKLGQWVYQLYLNFKKPREVGAPDI